MALNITQSPYEFLARWNRDGSLSGAHVKLLTSITDDTGSQPTQYIEGDVMPVAITGSIGFPIADVLSTLHVTTLESLEAEKLENTQLMNQLDALTKSIVTLEAKVAELTAQLVG